MTSVDTAKLGFIEGQIKALKVNTTFRRLALNRNGSADNRKYESFNVKLRGLYLRRDELLRNIESEPRIGVSDVPANKSGIKLSADDSPSVSNPGVLKVQRMTVKKQLPFITVNLDHHTDDRHQDDDHFADDHQDNLVILTEIVAPKVKKQIHEDQQAQITNAQLSYAGKKKARRMKRTAGAAPIPVPSRLTRNPKLNSNPNSGSTQDLNSAPVKPVNNLAKIVNLSTRNPNSLLPVRKPAHFVKQRMVVATSDPKDKLEIQKKYSDHFDVEFEEADILDDL